MSPSLVLEEAMNCSLEGSLEEVMNSSSEKAINCSSEEAKNCSKKRIKRSKDKTKISDEPPLTTRSHIDLIPMIPNDITQALLMACMPWYMKPLLMTLNRTWACTLKTPLYATPHYKPSALKNPVILYVYTSSGNDRSLSLYIYEDSILRKLPLPPHIAAESYAFTRFLVTDQCVYALTSAADQDKAMHRISKLDLGGGMINWQTLPPLPNIGKYVHILSSINGKSTHDYMWMRDSSIGTREYRYLSIEERGAMAEANDWSAMEVHTATTQGTGQCHSIPPPTRPVVNFSNHPPNYLDIYNKDKSRPRHLFKLYTVYECSLQVGYGNDIYIPGNITKATDTLQILLVFKDGYENCVIREVHNICKKTNRDGSIELLLFKRDVQNAERIEGDELNEFYECLRSLHPNWVPVPPEKISAVKFTADLSPRMNGWQQIFSLPSSKAAGLVLNDVFTIKVAQQGTTYVYLCYATLQGENKIPII